MGFETVHLQNHKSQIFLVEKLPVMITSISVGNSAWDEFMNISFKESNSILTHGLQEFIGD